jgi:hypothetical protein
LNEVGGSPVQFQISGTITVIHQVQVLPGTSPAATLADLEAMEARIMSKFDDTLTQLEANQTGIEQRITASLATDATAIAGLQAEIANGGITDVQQSRLDALLARQANTDPAVVSPTVPAGS